MAKATKTKAKPEPEIDAPSREISDIERPTALAAFSDREKFDEMVADIRRAVVANLPANLDMNNKKDRDVVRSLAAKIPKVKTRIDAWGAEQVEVKRKEVADMDALRKEFKDKLDELRAEVRKPLSDWEDAESLRLDTINATIEQVKELGRPGFGETAEQIQARMDKLPTHDLSFYAEKKEEAQIVIESAYNALVAAKTAAENAERGQIEREKERARLAVLEKENAEAELKRTVDNNIRRMKAIGNGILDDEPAETSALIKALTGMRVTAIYGDRFDEASDVKDAAMDKLNARLDEEAKVRAKKLADEAAEKARLDMEAEVLKAKEEAEKALDAAAGRAAELEAQLLAKEEAEKLAAEQAGKEAEESQQQIEQQRVALHMRTATTDERRERALAEAIEDVEQVIVDLKRYQTPQAIVQAIFKGKIRHVRFDTQA